MSSVSLQDAIIQMRRDLKEMIEYKKMEAVLIRAKYDSLIEQGFTEAQAVELCKT